jgi:nucleoside-diphosphate-sugar epimerase
MSRHAFIVGGTGQIGQAVAADLLADGWNVTISHRGIRPAPQKLVDSGAGIVVLDRDNSDALSRALGSGADVLIDITAYNLDHACQLIAVQDNVGSFVVISSSSVYSDDLGRTLDEASQNGFPELPNPIPEAHPTVDAGPTTYSTRKISLERHLLDHAAIPVTILRPCAVYGPGSRHPREWWFVKRILDGRPAIPLAYRGTSRFHTSAAVNIAALIRIVVQMPGRRVLNIADPVAPTVAEIATHIARHLDYNGRIVEVEERSDQPSVGRTPWSVPHPFVLDCRAALDLGYSPASTYAEAVKPACDWLVHRARQQDWKELVLAADPWNPFDYAAEDAFFTL